MTLKEAIEVAIDALGKSSRHAERHAKRQLSHHAYEREMKVAKDYLNALTFLSALDIAEEE